MMETKFTPGPWKWDLIERDSSWPGLYSAEEHQPLTFGWDGEEGIYLDNKFDAYLMAAAPELYRELEVLIRRIKENTIINQDLETAELALSKARGE